MDTKPLTLSAESPSSARAPLARRAAASTTTARREIEKSSAMNDPFLCLRSEKYNAGPCGNYLSGNTKYEFRIKIQRNIYFWL
jgi:hypothetical protein